MASESYSGFRALRKQGFEGVVDFLKVSRRLANPVGVFLMSLFLPHGRFSYVFLCFLNALLGHGCFSNKSCPYLGLA